jgi:hypothetical protein
MSIWSIFPALTPYSLYPTIQIPTANTIKSHLIKYYEDDKEKIKSILSDLPGKMSFTTDC